MRGVLEKLYKKYNCRQLIPPDPLQYVYRYQQRTDMEIVGFLSAILAYGRVEQIGKSITDLLGRMENKPFGFVKNFNREKRGKLKSFKHRFTSGENLADLFDVLSFVLNRFGSIEKFFIQGYKSGDKNILPALSIFCESLNQMHIEKHNTKTDYGLKFLLASPARKSACKRLNLFLRWMVRDDDVDTGLWRLVDKSKLLVPVDVHMGRLCKILGFYDHKTVSLKTAVEITESFAEIEPQDPVKYDFALSRIGIVEDCNGSVRIECNHCQLKQFCFKRNN